MQLLLHIYARPGQKITIIIYYYPKINHLFHRKQK